MSEHDYDFIARKCSSQEITRVMKEQYAEIVRLRDLISSFVSWLGREQQIKSVCSDQWERGYYAALKRCDTEIWKTSPGGDQR